MPRAGLLRVAARLWPCGLLSAAALAVVAPIALLHHGTERARACIAAYEAARGPELPDCRVELRWFLTPSRVPWTSNLARYRAEEVGMRAAVAGYTDAAVGRPDAAALARAADGLAAAEKVIQAGSQRISLEELGPAVGAPDVGRSAMLLGDRRTLLAGLDRWDHWSMRLRSLDAALIDGDVARAAAVAGRYAEFDPRDEDLRVAVAAMLCLGADPKRGLELLGTVQADRARDRHESWVRNWGEVRAAAVACAARANLPPPPPPERVEAGAADLTELRAALRMRLFARAHERDTPAQRQASFDLIQMLRGSAPQAAAQLERTAAGQRIDPTLAQMLKGSALPAGARVDLVAALLSAGHPIDATLAAEIVTPHTADGEPDLAPPPIELTAAAWVDPGRALRPMATPAALRDAVEKLRAWSELENDLPADERRRLRAAAEATGLAAGRALALAGDPDAAGAIRRTSNAFGGSPERTLALSSALVLRGDRGAALSVLDEAPSEDAFAPALRAAWLLQRAEILASLGRLAEAAREAVRADEAAAMAGDRRLDVRAQWTRLALAGSRRASTPARAGAVGWPWVGPMASASSWLEPAAESPDALAGALAFWDGARRASPEERRALRYAAVRGHRGDLPGAPAAYYLLAGGLLGEGEGDVEVWLDAFSATDTRAMTLRGYTWARAEAARWRGDAGAAALWEARYRALVKLGATEGGAELAALLGI